MQLALGLERYVFGIAMAALVLETFLDMCCGGIRMHMNLYTMPAIYWIMMACDPKLCMLGAEYLHQSLAAAAAGPDSL